MSHKLQGVDAAEILDFVSIPVSSVTGSDGPATLKDFCLISRKIVGIRGDRFSLATA
jgi:hypothetical protein